MGVISTLLGRAQAVRQIGQAVEGVAGAFKPNATQKLQLQHRNFQAALGQYAAEFNAPPIGFFDRAINGLNRLPRPMLAFGTMGLFVYAMVSPEAFAARMQGLAYVPEPLWWLLGAVVSFYFGAREMAYRRQGAQMQTSQYGELSQAEKGPNPAENAALLEWRGQNGR